jgi:undecaprenyl-diphosphatase
VTFVHSAILAILQGISELFPVSSLGHAVLLPALLHWHLNEQSPTWLAFLVALHLGTATALLIFFRDEWVSVATALVRSVQRGQMSQDHDERLAWMVVLGTIPAGIVGLALQDPLRKLFATPYVAASFLIVNGVVMFVGEQLMQRQMAARAASQRIAIAVGGEQIVTSEPTRYRDITEVSWRDAAIVGFAQVGALIPGISRSGVTMVAGLVAGLTHEAAARYAFLLATPIIFAAGVLELPQLFSSAGRPILGQAVLGVILAGVAAYLSVRFLMRYFESGRLYPFAYYCVAAGVFSLILLSVNL